MPYCNSYFITVLRERERDGGVVLTLNIKRVKLFMNYEGDKRECVRERERERGFCSQERNCSRFMTERE